MTRREGEQEIPVTQIELKYGVSAGISVKMLAGLIPLYEEHEARLERNIRIDDWLDMSEMEKALVIASRRVRIAMRNLQEEAQIEQSKRKART